MTSASLTSTETRPPSHESRVDSPRPPSPGIAPASRVTSPATALVTQSPRAWPRLASFSPRTLSTSPALETASWTGMTASGCLEL